MLKNKIVVKKIRNIVILLMAIIIMIGAYKNIDKSRAEDVIEIGAIALDNYGYLEEEEVMLQAMQTEEGLYEIELPESINTKKVNQIVNITLEDLEGLVTESTNETVTETVETQETETMQNDTMETEQETTALEDTETTEEVTETIDNNVIEIIDNKIILTQEQIDTKSINIEVVYDVAIVEKNEQEEYTKTLLSEKNSEEIANLEITEATKLVYNKVLTYEDEQNDKLVEIRGYFPKDSEIQIQELLEQEIEGNFNGMLADFAYDIKVIVKTVTQELIDENNPESGTEEVLKITEIVPKAYGEKCEIYIKDERVKQGTKIYQKGEDNNLVLIEAKENTEGNLSFETDILSAYAFYKEPTVITDTETNSNNTENKYETGTDGIDDAILNEGAVSVGSTAAGTYYVGTTITATINSGEIGIYLVSSSPSGPAKVTNGSVNTTLTPLGTSVSVKLARAGKYYIHLYNTSGNKVNSCGPYTIIEKPPTTVTDPPEDDNGYVPTPVTDTTNPTMAIKIDDQEGITVSGGENSNAGSGTAVVTADQIGKYVTNYASSTYTNETLKLGGWKIFYGDGENIYLIADDYIPAKYAPNGKGGTNPPESSGGYTLYLSAVRNDYTGLSDISEDIQNKWLSKYINYSGEGTKNTEGYNFKASAYLLDTNVWSTFEDGVFAEYAVGAPTIELLEASYNMAHPSTTQLEMEVITSNNYVAYQIVDEGTSAYIYEYPNVHFLAHSDDGGRHDGYYVASPHKTSNGYIWSAVGFSSSGGLQSANTAASTSSGTGWGIRPVVCLKNGYVLESNGDDTYKIVEESGDDDVYATDEDSGITGEDDVRKSWDVGVIIQDTGSGLASGASLQYAWSTSNTTEPTSWSTKTFTSYTAGTTSEVSTTITGSGLNGEYYLWIKPNPVEDVAGNANTTIITTGKFVFDNQNPVITVTPESNGWTNSGISVTISAVDIGLAGLLSSANGNSYEYYVSNESNPSTLEEVTWETYSSSGTTFTLNPGTSGEYYIFVKRISDTAGIGNTAGNTGTTKGTATTVSSVIYQRFGPYKFDYIKPTGTTTASTYYTNQPSVTAYVSASDTGGSGLKQVGISCWHENYTSDGTTVISSYDSTNNKYYTTFNFSDIEGPDHEQGMYRLDSGIYDNATNNYSPSSIPVIYDTTNPYLEITTNSNTTWAKTHTATITLKDDLPSGITTAGLATGAQIKYAWSADSSTAPTDGWKTPTVEYTVGATTATVDITGSGMTGQYYLWIAAVDVDDRAGNTADTTAVKAGPFFFDNTPPQISVDNPLTSSLIRNFNAKNNTGTGYSSSATTWKDLSGNNDGILTGGTWNGDYLTLDGTDDWVDFGYEQLGNTFTYATTVEIPTIKSCIVLSNGENGGASIQLDANGKPQFIVYIDEQNTYKDATSDTALVAGEKYHLAGTYDGKTIKLYVNGELKTETAMPGNIRNPQRQTVFAMGTNPSGSAASNGYVNINVYSAQVYNKALAAEEIDELLNGPVRSFDADNNTGTGHSNSATTWKDLAGNFDGIVNGPTWSDDYLSFDGTDDWVNLGEISLENAATYEATIEINEIQSGIVSVLGNVHAGGAYINLNDGMPGFSVYNANTSSYVVARASTALTTGEKHHLLGIFDGSSVKLYIDGALESETTFSGTYGSPLNNTVLALGTNPNGSGVDNVEWAKMQLYSVKVYDRVLTTTEIQTNFEESQRWEKTHNVDVTITDAHSGLAEGAQVQYAWSTSATEVPTTWDGTATVTGYSAGDSTATLTITNTTLTGKYYLWVQPINSKPVDTVGNITTSNSVSPKAYWFDNSAPIITVSPTSATVCKTTNVTITAEDVGPAGLSTSNTYQFFLSTSMEPTETGTLIDYTNGSAQTIGTGLTGTYYLFVKQVSDKATNLSITNGTLVTVGEEKYHRFGTYIFDNTAPTITVTPTSATVCKTTNVTIKAEDVGPAGLSTSNTYQFFLSTSTEPTETGTLTDYTNGSAKTIGTGLTGTYYLFVKQVSDKVGNVSTTDGTVVDVGGVKYHRFGTYIFDNTAPTITVNPTSATVCKTTSVTIKAEDLGPAGLSTDNTYEWFLSPNSNPLTIPVETIGTTVKGTYQKQGYSQTIGDGLTGTFYLFVRQVGDKVSNVSTTDGTVVSVGGNNYHRFGTYEFDNSAPTITVTPTSATVCKTTNVTIKGEDIGPAGIITTSDYRSWFLSTSQTPSTVPTEALVSGTYSSGSEQTIGDGLTGTYYLFVRQLFDRVSNASTTNGTVVDVGGAKYHRFGTYIFDNTPPTNLTYTAFHPSDNETYTSGTWTNYLVHTTISATDDLAGVKEIQYLKEGTSTWNTFNFSEGALTQSGTTWSGTETWNLINRNDSYYFKAIDNVGNETIIPSDPVWNIKYDISAPNVPTITNTSGGNWTNQDVTITATSTDNPIDNPPGCSELNRIEYSWDQSTWFTDWSIDSTGTDGTVQGKWTDEMNKTLYVRAVDNVENIGEVASTPIKIDKTKPVLEYVSKDIYLTNPNDVGNDDYANAARTVVIVFKGTDAMTNITSTLTADDIDVRVNGTTEVADTNKTLSVTPENGQWTSQVNYTLIITGITGDGVLNVVIPSPNDLSEGHYLQDEAGNKHDQTILTTSIDIEIDNTNPTVTFNVTSPGAGTYNDDENTITITATYNEDIYKEVTSNTLINDENDISIAPEMQLSFGGNDAKGIVTCSSVNGRVITYTYPITDGDNGEMVIKSLGTVYDAAGNSISASNVTPSVTITADTIHPTLTITADKTSPTNASSITYTFQFSENVTGFTEEDITFTASQNKATKTFNQVSASKYTLVVNTVEGYVETISVGVGANVCTDESYKGNGNLAAIPPADIVVDRVNPTITVEPDKTTNASANDYVKSLSVKITAEDIGSGLSSSNEYQYILTEETDETTLAGLTWTTYTSDSSFTIGENKTGIFYLYVKQISDNAGNLSDTGGTIYHKFGPYKFDNTIPTYTSVEVKNVDKTGYDVYVYGVSDSGSGIDRVNTQIWTENNAKDDVVNGLSTAQGSGTYYYRVNVIDHNNEEGWYNTEIYMYDKLGNETIINTIDQTWVDRTSPDLSLSVQSNSEWKKSHSVTVIASDNSKEQNSGFASNLTFKYGWSQDLVTAPSYTTVTPGNSAGATEITFNATEPQNTLTGEYYLWVTPNTTPFKDLHNNEFAVPVKSTGKFLFDNTDPTITLEKQGDTVWAHSHTVGVTITDEHAGLKAAAENGIVQYGWAKLQSDGSVSQPTEWITVNLTNADGANTLTFDAETIATTELLPDGKYELWVKVENLEDTAGNTITSTTESTGTFWIDRTPPAITLVDNNNDTWKNIQTTTVNLTDTASGLKTGVNIKYGWSKTLIDEPNTWATANISTYSDEEQLATFIATTDGLITQSEQTGKYYLWVKPISYTDVALNEQSSIKKSTGTFAVDRTPPEITIDIVRDGLVRAYDADNNTGNGHSEITTWKDLSGNNDGTLTGGTWNDEYLTVNGTDEWVNMGQVSIDNEFTLETEVEFNSITAIGHIFSNHNSSGVAIMFDNSGRIVMNMNDGTTSYALSSGFTAQVGEKYHIVATFDGTNMKIYINGELKGTKAGAYAEPTNSTVFALGANPTGNNIASTQLTNINIYSARIYNKALTQAQIQQNMNAENNNKTWQKSHDITVTISDEHAGLGTGASLEYAWSTDGETAPTSGYTTATINSYSAGAASTTFTASGSGMTGKYFLWVRPKTSTSLKDNAEPEYNYQTETAVSLSRVYFDNEAPTLLTYDAYHAVNNSEYVSGTWTKPIVYTDISTTDVHSGVSKIQYSTDGTNWEDFEFDISALTQQSGTYTWKGTQSWALPAEQQIRDDSYYFRAIDNLGNTTTISSEYDWNIKYDLVNPEWTAVLASKDVANNTATITITAIDAHSGYNSSTLSDGNINVLVDGISATTIGKTLTGGTGGVYTLQLTNIQENVRQSGKSYREWSGNFSIEILAGNLTDNAGVASGTTGNTNTAKTLPLTHIDVVEPEITYKYADTTINHTDKTLTLEFDVVDKFFSSTDIISKKDQIIVKLLDENVTIPTANITRTLTKVDDVYDTDGTTKIGERYELVIGGLEQKFDNPEGYRDENGNIIQYSDGITYSGPISITFPAETIVDTSNNKNIATTITIGINEDDGDITDGGDGGTQQIVDVVDPIWNATVETPTTDANGKTSANVTLMATDKYFKESLLTRDNIQVLVDEENKASELDITLSAAESITNGVKHIFSLTNFEEDYDEYLAERAKYAQDSSTGRLYREFSGPVKIVIPKGMAVDNYGNDSEIRIIPIATIDALKPEVTKVSSAVGTNKYTIVFDITDKYIASSAITTSDTSKIHVLIDGEDATSSVTKTITDIEPLSATINGTSKTIGYRYTLEITGFEKTRTSIDYTREFTDWSGTVSIKIDADTAKDSSGTGNAETVLDGGHIDTNSDGLYVDTNATESGNDFVDFIKPDVTYKYVESAQADPGDINYEGKTFTMVFDITDKYFNNSTLTIDDLIIKIDGEIPDWNKVSKTLDVKDIPDDIPLHELVSFNKTVDGAIVKDKHTIGKRYTLVLDKLEQLQIQSGDQYLDYSGVITVEIPAGKVTDTKGNSNNLTTITSGIDIPGGAVGDSEIVDVVDPLIQKVSTSAYAVGQTAEIKLSATDKYYDATNSSLTGKVQVLINGAVATEITPNLGTASPIYKTGTTDQQVGIEQTITITGFEQNVNQVAIRILEDAIKDASGNGNKQTDLIIYNVLRLTDTEYDATNAENWKIKTFLGESDTTTTIFEAETGSEALQRQNIEKVIFVNSTEGSKETGVRKIWDVSAQGDDSILAWYSAPVSPATAYTVYIGSDSEIFANQNSIALFSYIGFAESCTEAETIKNLHLLNTSSVTNMELMFHAFGYRAMTSLDLGDFDTKNVTYMNAMFRGCGLCEMTSLDLGNLFDTSNVKSMPFMFEQTGENSMITLDLGDKFNTSKVKNMQRMFNKTGYSKMTNMYFGTTTGIEEGVVTLPDNFNTSEVSDMMWMFKGFGYGKIKKLNLGTNFDTSNVTDMSKMFNECGYTAMTSLNLGNKFNTENVTDMSYMFQHTGYTAMTSLELGDKFYTTSATDMSNMFNGCGQTVMTSLDLGPAFTRISYKLLDESGNETEDIAHTDFATNTGTSGCVIYAPEAIYKNKNAFKLSGTDTLETSDNLKYTTGTINPIYKPEWTLEGTTTNKSAGTAEITIKGKAYKQQTINANVAINYAESVTSALTTGDVSIFIGNTNITALTNPTISASTTTQETVTAGAESKQINVVTHTITLSNLDEAVRVTGIPYNEWAGYIKIKVHGRGQATSTYTANELKDGYGNQNMMEIDTTGTWQDVRIGNEFVDFIKPEFRYEYANTVIEGLPDQAATADAEKKVMVVFDVLDKYFASSTLANTDITLKVISPTPEVTLDATKFSKTLALKTIETETTNATSGLIYKTNGDIYFDIDGNGTAEKVGQRYELVISDLDQGNAVDYSGPMSITFGAGKVTDGSNNSNNQSTITIGINETDGNPETGDGGTQTKVDTVNPLWSYEGLSVTTDANGITSANLTLTTYDKYLCESSLAGLQVDVAGEDKTSDLDITITRNDDVNTKTVTRLDGNTETVSAHQYIFSLTNFEETLAEYLAERAKYLTNPSTGRLYREFSGPVQIKIPKGASKDESGNDSELFQIPLGAIDALKPEIIKVKSSVDTNAKTQTIVFDVTDKYIASSAINGTALNEDGTINNLANADTSKIHVLIDGEDATSSVTKTITNIEKLSATINGTSKTIGYRYTLKLSDFEEARTSAVYGEYTDWSGKVTIKIDANTATDSNGTGNAETILPSDHVDTNAQQSDYVDYVKPDVTYIYAESSQAVPGDINYSGKTFKMQFDITDKYYDETNSSILTKEDLTILIDGELPGDTDGNGTLDNGETCPITITLPNPTKIEDTVNGDTVTIGYRYTLTLSDLEQLQIKSGDYYLDYSGVITVGIPAGVAKDKVVAGKDESGNAINVGGNSNDQTTITSGFKIAGGIIDNTSQIVDVVDPLIEKVSTSAYAVGGTAEITLRITDKYLSDTEYVLSDSEIQILVNGSVVTSGITKTLSNPIYKKVDASGNLVTTDNVSEAIGVEYTVTITGYAQTINQLAIRILEDSAKDDSGNGNKQTDLIAYNVLKLTNGEATADSAFLGSTNTAIKRQIIEKVTFKTLTRVEMTTWAGLVGTDSDNYWDASALGDKSIIAHSTDTDSNGAYEVTIGSHWEIFGNQDSSYLFYAIGRSEDCDAVSTINAINLLNTSSVTNMRSMFNRTGYTAMTALNLGAFDTKNVTDMREMFYNTGNKAMSTFSLGTEFDTSKVNNMKNMFFACGQEKMGTLSLGSKFNTSQVQDMTSMFSYCGKKLMTTLSLGSLFDTSNVKYMESMFLACGQENLIILDLGSKFNTSKVENMARMFYSCGQGKMTTLNLGGLFDTSNVTDMSYMFYYCGNGALQELDLGDKFDTSKVTNMRAMFYRTGYTVMTKLDLGPKFNTAKVTDMYRMFYNTGATEMVSLDLGDLFYTTSVTNMVEMFYKCGMTKMNVLDLGPAFTRIPTGTITYINIDDTEVTTPANQNMFTNCGTTELIIYAPEAIYGNKTAFK